MNTDKIQRTTSLGRFPEHRPFSKGYKCYCGILYRTTTNHFGEIYTHCGCGGRPISFCFHTPKMAITQRIRRRFLDNQVIS